MSDEMNPVAHHGGGTEDMIFGSCCLITSVLVMFTNAVVVVVILQSRELHLPTLYIVAFMAVFDFLLGLYSLVFAVPGFFLDRFAYASMPTAVIACLHGFLIAQGMMNTAMTVFDRFFAIKFPLKYAILATKKNLIIISMVSLLLNLIKTVLQYYLHPRSTFNPFTVWIEIDVNSNWFTLFSFQFIIVPFVVISICSFAIIIEIRKMGKRVAPIQIQSVSAKILEHEKERKLTERLKEHIWVRTHGISGRLVRIVPGEKESLRAGTKWTQWTEQREKLWARRTETLMKPYNTRRSASEGSRWTSPRAKMSWTKTKETPKADTRRMRKKTIGDVDPSEGQPGSQAWTEARKKRAIHKGDIKCTLMIMIYVVAFYVSFFPVCILLVWSYVTGSRHVPHLVRSVAAMASFCGSFFNVFIYTATYKPFRDALVHVFCKSYYRRKRQRDMLDAIRN